MGLVSPPAEIVLLCEDRQQEVFVRRFLQRYFQYPRGKLNHLLRIEMSPPGLGAADNYVRGKFPAEVKAHRRRGDPSRTRLIAMADGDKLGPAARVRQLADACRQQGIAARTDAEKIAVFVPTWNIETWIEWLRGHEVDEGRKDYPKLPRESECQPQVNELTKMCKSGKLRQPAPPSLSAGCTEFRRRCL